MGSNRPPSDTALEQVARSIAPCTLPPQAWGTQPIHWYQHGTDELPTVWAWITWPHRVTERLEAVVLGMNDRVCIVEIRPDIWSRWQPVVWRAAVTRRDPDP